MEANLRYNIEVMSIDREPSVKSRAVRVIGGVLLGTALGIGLDQGPKSVDAQTPTPTSTSTRTPTPTGTPTPDRLATQVTDARATVTALEEQRKKEEELAKLHATATAIQDVINQVRGTPTRTATPSPTRPPDATAIAESTRIANLAKFQAQIIATATADAEATARARAPKEATPVPPRPAPAQPGGVKDEHDPTPGPDIGGLIPLAVVLAGGGALVWQRRRIGRWIRRVIH